MSGGSDVRALAERLRERTLKEWRWVNSRDLQWWITEPDHDCCAAAEAIESLLAERDLWKQRFEDRAWLASVDAHRFLKLRNLARFDHYPPEVPARVLIVLPPLPVIADAPASAGDYFGQAVDQLDAKDDWNISQKT